MQLTDSNPASATKPAAEDSPHRDHPSALTAPTMSPPLRLWAKIIIMSYEVAWLLGWLWLLFHARYYIYHLYMSPYTWAIPLWIGEAAVLGSIGGVMYTIHGLYTGRMTRDPGVDKWLWYLVKPIHGAVMGAICGLLSRVVLAVSGSTGVSQHILIGSVGLVCGMYEHIALGLIRSFADKKLGVKM